VTEGRSHRPTTGASSFNFGLLEGPVDACFERDTVVDADLRPMPAAGKQFRDQFTTACLVVLQLPLNRESAPNDDTLVIGTEYGNAEAIGRLQREAGPQGRLLSAQYFPHATSSSAAAFGSIAIGATGRNVTINAGHTTPVVAAWQAMLALARGRSSTSHLLVGDVYTPEAEEDAAARSGSGTSTSALFRVSLRKASTFTAHYRFPPAVKGTDLFGSRVVLPDGATVTDDSERNPAIGARRFWHSVANLALGEQSEIALFERSGRAASLLVTRNE